MATDREVLERLPREALLEIAYAAMTALSRVLDYEDKKGFPPGSTAWAMGHDLRGPFKHYGVRVIPFGQQLSEQDPNAMITLSAEDVATGKSWRGDCDA